MSEWTLHHGDCIAGMADVVEPASSVITDPPYDEHTHSKQRSGTSVGVSEARDLGFAAITDGTIQVLARQFARLSRRWVLVFCADRQIATWGHALMAAGLEWVRLGMWVKLGAAPQFTGDRPAQGHEAIVIAHHPGKKRWNGGGRHGVWTHPIESGAERFHTTQKPLSLMDALVRDFTDRGETILDPFAGSGTTGVAAIRQGRRFLGFELDETYHRLASRRLAKAREQLGWGF